MDQTASPRTASLPTSILFCHSSDPQWRNTRMTPLRPINYKHKKRLRVAYSGHSIVYCTEKWVNWTDNYCFFFVHSPFGGGEEWEEATHASATVNWIILQRTQVKKDKKQKHNHKAIFNHPCWVIVHVRWYLFIGGSPCQKDPSRSSQEKKEALSQCWNNISTPWDNWK